MKTISNPAPESVQSDQHDNDFVQKFTDAFISDDFESFLDLIAPDCEWVIRATGETFRGHDQIKQLANRSIASRNHRAGLGIKPINVFINAAGTKLCWEYVLATVVTDKWPPSTRWPAPGTRLDLPIVLVCEIHQGKLVKVREYFDMLSVIEPGTSHRLYA
jgi:ketosteroid isomerase-like protein